MLLSSSGRGRDRRSHCCIIDTFPPPVFFDAAVKRFTTPYMQALLAIIQDDDPSTGTAPAGEDMRWAGEGAGRDDAV